MSQSLLVRIGGTLNSDHYISVVLRLVVLPINRVQQNATVSSVMLMHFADIGRIYLDTENARQLPWSAQSPDLSSKSQMS